MARELIEPIRSALRHLFTRAVERGELPEALDVELAVDLIHGTVVYRVMLTRGDLAEATAHLPQLIALLARERAMRRSATVSRVLSSSSAGRGSARPRS